MSNRFRMNVLRLVSVALISMGWMQVSVADVISTQYVVDSESRAATLSKIDTLLVQDQVAKQLQAFGVDADDVSLRLQGMTTAELISLEGQLDSQIAGGGALGVIGAVFLVLLILELVGVTDIFKSF
jgi:hypothetical protein